jgi:2,3-bisphosphoglycerate-independent phosphoglycerate mutase
MARKPVVLIIRDGWGSNHNAAHDAFNAIKLAPTPVADALTDGWPRTEIMACGLDVGLPEGVMGNSEVGHQNIGAGRIVDQELVRIDKAFADGRVRSNETLQAALRRARAGGKLHFFGLVSDAGVHSMLAHLDGLLEVCAQEGVNKVFVHAFTDGRDTAPTSGLGFVRDIEAKMAELGVGRVASVCGRFWSMDRDLRWERVRRAYDCLTGRRIERTAASATEAVQFYYDNPLDASRKGDEFVVPTAVVGEDGKPVALVEDGDAVLFFNFRGDRPRELTRAFIEDGFDGFDRGPKLDLFFATMTEYQKGLCPDVIFRKPAKMKHILGSFVADLGIPQFRCAETEKFPHVTFFFNDYREEPFDFEDRALIPSPKEVPTYDQKPEMSAYGIRDATKEAILSGRYGLVVVNFANADMVGHTGSLEAAIEACAVVDECVGELLEAVDLMKGRAIITADHGNSDQMKQEDGSAHTAHTLNPVELILYGEGCTNLKLREGGRLGDIAPTILRLMGLPQPVAMTGRCLIVEE